VRIRFITTLWVGGLLIVDGFCCGARAGSAGTPVSSACAYLGFTVLLRQMTGGLAS
jgi:hypothetical protein